MASETARTWTTAHCSNKNRRRRHATWPHAIGSRNIVGRKETKKSMISSRVRVKGSPEPRRRAPNACPPAVVCMVSHPNFLFCGSLLAKHQLIDVLRELVRSVVREELQRQQLNSNPATISSLAEVVREEVRQAFRQQQPQAQPQASLPVQPAISYAEVLRGTPGRTFVTATTHLPEPRFTPPPPEMRHAIATFECEEQYDALQIVDDDVTVPQRSSIAVTVRSNVFSDYEGMADSFSSKKDALSLLHATPLTAYSRLRPQSGPNRQDAKMARPVVVPYVHDLPHRLKEVAGKCGISIVFRHLASSHACAVV
ncbi:hypothetical protein HPB52_003393 [Rhipicephalus sanguineus]|uniref:Uncharacterized protein n=1 Tax=Rhipicephalus sanguineus TaxID=34632 RepID=A0A9D4QG39_RHISA|nr:hypothetical protein HPB52_003393 [Rhipicephalus sanguineus]